MRLHHGVHVFHPRVVRGPDHPPHAARVAGVQGVVRLHRLVDRDVREFTWWGRVDVRRVCAGTNKIFLSLVRKKRARNKWEKCTVWEKGEKAAVFVERFKKRALGRGGKLLSTFYAGAIVCTPPEDLGPWYLFAHGRKNASHFHPLELRQTHDGATHVPQQVALRPLAEKLLRRLVVEHGVVGLAGG